MPLSRRALLLLLPAPLLAVETRQLQGGWSATDGQHVFTGSWTARTQEEPDTGGGAWSLFNTSGDIVLSGAWSVRKAGGVWRGSWQARITRGRTFSGTWTAKTNAPASSGFAYLLEAAVSEMVTGTWKAEGGRSGGWSIRTNARR